MAWEGTSNSHPGCLKLSCDGVGQRPQDSGWDPWDLPAYREPWAEGQAQGPGSPRSDTCIAGESWDTVATYWRVEVGQEACMQGHVSGTGVHSYEEGQLRSQVVTGPSWLQWA